MPSQDDLPPAVCASLENDGAGVIERHRHAPLAGVGVGVRVPELEVLRRVAAIEDPAEVVVERLLERDLTVLGLGED